MHMGTRARHVYSNAAAVGAVIGAYALITALVAAGSLTTWDLATRNQILEHFPGSVVSAAATLAHIGQGSPLAALTLALAVARVVSTKSVKPVALWAIAFVLLLALVGPVKIYTRRGAPRDPSREAVTFYGKDLCGDPSCQSYPSGHVANAIVWYGLAALLLGSALSIYVRRTIQVAAAGIAMVTTVVSGFHWLTDAFAGALAGLAAYFMIRACSRLHERYWTVLDAFLISRMVQLGHQCVRVQRRWNARPILIDKAAQPPSEEP